MKKKPRAYIVTRLAPFAGFEEEIYRECAPYPWGKRAGVVCGYRTGGHSVAMIICSGDPVTTENPIKTAQDTPLTVMMGSACVAQALKDSALNQIENFNVIDVYGPAEGETLKQVLDRAEADMIKRGKEKRIGLKKPVFGIRLVPADSHTKNKEPTDQL